ncbi:MAG: hypothetical protein RSB71_02870 [Bacilli bacterium]
MKKNIKNINNDKMDIEVIRYFINNNNEYLIYSLNEIDNAGYTKLYISKIIGNSARIINDEEEWVLIKNIIKEVVRSNRDGSPLSIIDLDECNLDNVVLQDTKVFKLQGNLVNLLSENKQDFSNEEPSKEIIEEPIDESLEEELQVDVLNKRIIDLEAQVNKYQQQINSIKHLLEE